ncbi:MAG TPA: hypothetical protein VGO55_15715 [Allosphingosinicella sp.]|jgi:hypothetical protein|nr:hypothetical protein [Allosphingosinicella sp.]
MPRSILKPILIATLVAGTLDILAATALTLVRGSQPMGMLRFVASGPFPGATQWGTQGSLLGLAVHFALMAIIVTVFMLAASRWDRLREKPFLWGFLYGLATYVVMNLIVVPLRWPANFPPSPLSVATQLFCHIVLVGIPIALIARRYLRRRSAFG